MTLHNYEHMPILFLAYLNNDPELKRFWVRLVLKLVESLLQKTHE